MRTLLLLFFSIPLLSQDAGAIFYGEDDYLEIDQIPKVESGVDWRKLSRSVGVMIDDPGAEGLDLSRAKAIRERFRNPPLDPDYKYGEQPRLGKVTVFLIDRDKIMTAGHAGNRKLQKAAFIFDFTWNSKEKRLHKSHYKASEIYRCKKVLSFRRDKMGDYAICQLDRPVTDRKPLELEVFKNAGAVGGKKAKMISAPDGGPLKWTSDGQLLDQRPSKHAPTLNLGHYFFHTLDNSYGSSGAPIFDAGTGKVIGVQTGGDDNFTERKGVLYPTRGDFKQSNLRRPLKGEWGCLIPPKVLGLLAKD